MGLERQLVTACNHKGDSERKPGMIRDSERYAAKIGDSERHAETACDRRDSERQPATIYKTVRDSQQQYQRQ